ncbi:GlxA family transcriptional regulator, partial [Pseudomonas sp. SIMBA_067]
MVHPATAPVSPCTVKTFGFLILPNFTTIGLASAVETLRMANLAARRPMFRTVLIAASHEPV